MIDIGEPVGDGNARTSSLALQPNLKLFNLNKGQLLQLSDKARQACTAQSFSTLRLTFLFSSLCLSAKTTSGDILGISHASSTRDLCFLCQAKAHSTNWLPTLEQEK